MTNIPKIIPRDKKKLLIDNMKKLIELEKHKTALMEKMILAVEISPETEGILQGHNMKLTGIKTPDQVFSCAQIVMGEISPTKSFGYSYKVTFPETGISYQMNKSEFEQLEAYKTAAKLNVFSKIVGE